MLYAHRLWTKKSFFDESVRTPLFLSCPSAALAGKQSDALVEHIDLFPTIMDVLDIKTPSTVQGRSLLPLLRGVTETHRPYVRSERAEAMIMQFDGRFKYIDNGPGEITELYDDVNDPREITNLAYRPEYRERIAKVIQELRAWAKQDVRKAPIAEKNRRGGDQS